MTHTDFIDTLEALGWTRSYLARVLRCDTNLPGRWADGRAEVPQVLGDWLKRLADFQHRNPPPSWRTNNGYKEHG